MVRKKKNQNKKYISPIIMIIIIMIFIIFISTVFSLLGIEGTVTSVNNGSLETSLVTMNNILTPKGFKYFFNHVIVNLSTFKPLFYLIISLIGIGIAEKSGLLEAVFKPFRRMKPSISTFIVLLLSIIAAVLGDAGYAIMIPLSAVIYKYLNRNPMMGILTSFLGLSVGYGTSFIYNNSDFILGTLMEEAAKVEVDRNFQFTLYSNLYITVSSMFILSFLGTIIIERFLAPKFSRKNKYEIEEHPTNKKAMLFTFIAMIMLILFVAYSLIPGFPGSGLLLDQNAESYVEKIWGDNAPFHDGFVYIFTTILSILGLIYGAISKNIKNNQEYSDGLAYEFKDLGYLFVLIFLVSQLIGIIEWTHLDQVIGGRLVEFLSLLQFSGLPLILLFFFIVVFLGIIIPSTETKWNLIAPLTIPLFMRSNIAPEFTMFIFKGADGFAKCLTPLSGGFTIMLGFLKKYNQEDEAITLFGTLGKLKSTIALFAIVWLLILSGWYLVGLPLGYGVLPTL